MRSLSRIFVLVFIAALGPSAVEASCVGAAQIGSSGPGGRSGIWTAGQFSPIFYPGYLPFDYTPPVTPMLVGAFWSLGTGDPALGSGDDNGTFDVSQWFSFYGPGAYGSYFAGEVSATWSADPGIDGCIANGGPTPGFDDVECAAVLLVDVHAGRGHFAIVSRKVDSAFNAYLNQPGDGGIVLAPMGAPAILYASGLAYPGEPKLDVLLAPPGLSGAYLDPACGTNVIAGYRVWVKYLPSGAQPPITRDRLEWQVPVSGAQVVPLGSSTTVTVNLPIFPGQDIYFSYSLVFDSGFETPFVSANSARINCDLCWIDQDGDGWAGWRPESSVDDPAILETEPGPDCDDDMATVFPGAVQDCDGINNDCDDPAWPGLAGTNEGDADADTYSECDGDCDDAASLVFPGADEICDGRDNDCNALTDDDADGVDSDADLVANACDNCRFDRNPAQGDLDSDGEGDICDLDDGMIYVLNPARDDVSWQQELGFSGWNVYRGDLDVLRSGGPYTQLPGSNDIAARVCALSATSLGDADRPDPGQAAFYLVSGTAGPVEGDLGTNSAGAPRANVNPCP